MLVRSYGFSINAGNGKVSLNDLITHLSSNSGQENNSLSNLRKIFLDSSDKNFAVGLVVTVKDQKTFCELVNNKGNFVITVNNLKGKNKLMEFNFFVINKSNGLGLYQHYFQSCSPGTFGTYLNSYYRQLSENSRDTEINNLKKTNKYTNKKEKDIRSSHAKGLDFSILVHKESLEKVLSKFQEIKSMEYEFSQLEPDLIKGAPLATYVNKMRQKIAFKPGTSVSLLSKAIQETVKKLNFKSGRISVIDHVNDEDIPLSVKIANIPEHFGEEDYDVVAGKLNNLDVTKFSNHAIPLDLLKKCKESYSHIFMKTIRNKKT